MTLPLPEEPRALKDQTRALLEQAPEAGQRLLEDGEWIIAPLWQLWGDDLRPLGMDREQLRQIAIGYRNELRFWVVGERPWEHAVSGLSGRVTRRVNVEQRALCEIGAPQRG